MIVGAAHAEPPGEVAHKRTSNVADATVVDILHEDEHGDRVRAAGVDPSAFRHINEAGEDVEVCRESLELRVLALDVPRVLDEDTLIRPKPVKANLGEHVNAEVVESERCSSKPVDALHHIQAVTWRKTVAGHRCHVDLLVALQRSTDECRGSVEVD
jgi:hypothetical protein